MAYFDPEIGWVEDSHLPVEGYDPVPAERAALRQARVTKRENALPVADDRNIAANFFSGPSNPERPAYVVEPDLQEAQGGMHLPTSIIQDDAGQLYYKDTKEPVPMIPRYNNFPFVHTPEGLKFAMPKNLDLLSNVMGNVGGKVVAKPGEMVLGSGLVRTAEEVKYPLAKPNERWTNTLGQNDDKLKLMTPDEFLKQGRPLKIDVESRETIDALKQHIQEGKPLDPLELHANGKEDGRHRAIAAKELGIKEVPVLNFRPSEPFYSALERTVENAKINLATPEQWLGYLRNQPGIKAEEINTVLKDMPQGMISKEQLSDIVKANKVELKEKVLDNSKTGKILTPDSPSFDPDKLKRDNATQYHQYQLPGGENYKETLLSLPARTVPNGRHIVTYTNEKGIKGSLAYNTKLEAEEAIAAAKASGAKNTDYKIIPDQMEDTNLNYKAPHFNEHGTNLVGHVRTNERELPELGKGTHIEELQSDWGSAIRDKGFKGEKEKLEAEFSRIEEKLMATNNDKMLGLPTVKQVLEKAVEDGVMTKAEANTYKRYTDIENSTPAPDMPFKKNWDEVLIKRTIRDAVDKGHKFITVTPGKAQALRYQDEIRQKIDTINWIPRTGKNGERVIKIKPTNGSEQILLDTDKHGNIINGPSKAKGQPLSDVIGKDIARQILEKPEGNIDAKGYVMGAEGMKGYYDKMVIDKFNSVGKKYGAKMEPFGQTIKDGNYKIRQSVDGDWQVLKDNKIINEFGNQKEAAEKYFAEKSKGQPVHYFPITPELEKKVKEGFELFSSANPTLIPVDYQPQFEDKKQSKFKLVPVDQQPVFE